MPPSPREPHIQKQLDYLMAVMFGYGEETAQRQSCALVCYIKMRLRGYSRYQLESRYDVSYVLAETYLIAERKIESGEIILKEAGHSPTSAEEETKQRNVEPWLKRIIFNVIRDLNKKEKAQEAFISKLVKNGFCSYPETLPSGFNDTLDENQKASLQKALEELSDKDRDILISHYVEELQWKEIGEKLDIPDATVRKRGQRALGRLREKFFSIYPDSKEGGRL